MKPTAAKLVLVALLVAAAFAGSAVRPAPAAAASPCWKTLLTDWYDGRIDDTYPIHCYQDALKHLPADVETYSSAHDDIYRALQSAKAKLRRAGKQITPNTEVPPETGSGSGSKGGGKPSTTTTTAAGNGSGTTTTSGGGSPGRASGGGLEGVGSSGPSSLPVPLLVLGGLAVLLVAAGAAGLLAKRWQARKPAP